MDKIIRYTDGMIAWTYKPWWGKNCEYDDIEYKLDKQTWSEAYECMQELPKDYEVSDNKHIWGATKDNTMLVPGIYKDIADRYYFTKYEWHYGNTIVNL